MTQLMLIMSTKVWQIKPA